MTHLLRTLVGLGLVTLVFMTPAFGAGSELPTLEPLNVHPRATRFIVDQVRSNHLIRNAPLDDAASSEIFDRYLEVLDRRKQFLLAKDIAEFEAFRYGFDDALKRGQLSLAFKIVNRAQSRRDTRYTWILERLEQGIESFDLTTHTEIPIDADDLAWPKNMAEADLRWEHNLTDAIITMRLNERETTEIQELLTKRYTNRQNQIRQYTSEEAFADYINSFTHIYDPHTVYFSPRTAEDFHMQMRMSLEGIGALLGTEDEYVKVISLVKGGPAELNGELKPADRIVGVGQEENGPMIDVVGRRIQDVVDLIRGPSGTTVRLEVLEPVSAGGASKIVAIEREKVKLEEAAAKKKIVTLNHNEVERRIGVIELPKMYADLEGEQRGEEDYRSASRDVEKLIYELQEENIDGLILDLRDNGGGSLPEAHKLVGLFIETGPTVLVKGLGRARQTMKDNNKAVAYDGPLAVLVNRSSASASEIFAGAIQDYGRGLVLGSQTYGKGSIQSILSLNHGQLKITQGKYYRITGETTQHQGVHPDIEFPGLIDAEAVGESAYSNALALDKMDPAEFDRLGRVDGLIEALQSKHEERIETDPYFDYYERVEERIEFHRSITSVSLNEEVRRARKAEIEAWRIEIGNDYLTNLGKEAVATIDELDEAMDEVKQERADKVDGMVKESGRILLDFVYLKLIVAFNPAVQ
ncbi:MAG: tail-specific protease [Gammaproteobacteria bacterium]|nr:tail-specific protease [Gammaproteobacteria bacterium]